ncbi:NAD(P)H-dependent oxidoreductase [Pseudoalteromonas sp. C2R02]|uniref:NAD(P)H-dependent oxidoreductase n=1 Tax=Pseudoalteromonas sp. C2R02 TaxID=2841565 RepID=UPI001C090BFC|nr:NAD(P)H-dependent oxidoreductase [Pseudoalteromonas sp. C2R02]MBU2971437.1 NAD(P)H-dependent oxidoreductase [Pseudoalteromonas sp. C2R02]
MNLLIVSGSQRTESQSAKVANYIVQVEELFDDVSHIELCKHNLPFWDGEHSSKLEAGSEWPLINKKIQKADALVLITPEWGGMATPILKNFLLMCDAQDTAHKPVLLTSVVSGISGAYPIAELKMNALKNNKLVATPDHLIIRNVEQVLNDNPGQDLTPRDTNLRDRIDYSLHMLHQYSGALKMIRAQHHNQPFPKQQEYLYGM